MLSGKNSETVKNDGSRMEISLNTSGYKPSELSVNVRDGELIIEGRHEEKSESGETMVSRQFRRQYALSDDVKTQEVVSNLSQDGLLIVTLPKEKKIQEIKEDSRKSVGRNSSPFSTMSSSKSSQSTSSSSTKTDIKKTQSMTPFKDDPWQLMQEDQKQFFEKSRKQFEENMKKMKENMKEMTKEMKTLDFDNKFSPLNLVDEHELKIVDVEDKLEISLDTTGYKPDELKVTAGEGVVMIEARHEERSEQGQVMVSRHMKRSYPLPASAQPHQVVSNLSRDGVLVITVPKIKTIKQQSMDVPININ